MNIFSSLFSLLALAAAVPLGIHKAAAAALRDAGLMANATWRDLRRLFLTHVAKPTNTLLVVSLIGLGIVMGLTHYLLPAEREPGSWLYRLVWALDGVAGLSAMFHLVRLARQWYAKPKYVMARYQTEEDTQTGRRKLKLVNGRPVRAADDDATAVVREVRDEQGARIVDVGAKNYIPKYFSFTLSLGIIIVTYVLVTGLLAFAAAAAESRLIAALTIVCALPATALAYILTQFLAWGYRKGADLAERIPTAVIQAALRIVDAGITIENVQKVFGGINITEQERHAPRIAGLVPKIAEVAFLFLLTVWVQPKLIVAVIAAVVMGFTGFLNWGFERRGGRMEVANRGHRLWQVLSKYAPVTLGIAIACEQLIYQLWGSALRDQLSGLWTWFLEVLSGRQPLLTADPKMWGTYLALFLAGLFFFGLFGKIGGHLKKAPATRPSYILGMGMRYVGAAMLIMGVLKGTQLLMTFGKTGGTQEIAIPKGGVTPVKAEKLAAATVADGKGVHLTWLDKAENEDGYFVQRRVAQDIFADVGGIQKKVTRVVWNTFATIAKAPVNAHEWKDSDVELGKSYDYQVIAFNGIRESEPTNIAEANIPAFIVLGQAPATKSDAEPSAPDADVTLTAEAKEADADPDATPETKKEAAPLQKKQRVKKEAPTQVAEEAPAKGKGKYGVAIVPEWAADCQAANNGKPCE